MDFKELLQKDAKEIEKQTQILLKKYQYPLTSDFTKACLGGKKVRGSLIMLGFQIAGGTSKEIINVACAYEILHTAILVHDDIMDQSPLRRGVPALYKKTSSEVAMTLGDFGFFLSMKLIVESKLPNKEEALKIFANTLMDTAVGQIMDLKKLDPETTALLKTARYTIAGPLQLGATLAGASKEQINLLGEFGEDVGIVFQIQDDLLDGEATEGDRKKALEYILKAKKLVSQITADDKMQQLLESMLRFMVERKN